MTQGYELLIICSSSECEAASPSDISNRGNKNDYYNSGREGGRGFVNKFLRRLQKIKVADELMSLGKIAFPLLLSGLILHSKSIVCMLFLGHLGNIELAGGSLSMGFANITGYAVIKGLAMGMEPICCQAYGAKKGTVLSQTFKQTLCLLLLAAIPITLLWLNMEPILLSFGQDETITSVAKVFITYSIPELLAQALLHPLRIFIRAQNLIKPLLLSATCAMILHLPISYFLAIYLDLGVRGVALASACNTLNLSLALLAYLFFSETAIKPWDGQAVTKSYRVWHPLLTLMVPSVLSVCLEWWWYEIMVLLCGLINNPEASVAAMGILIQTTGVLYVFPNSLSLSLSTRVGQDLGAEAPAQARQITIIGLIIAMVWGLAAFAFTIAVKDVWGKVYTSEPQVLALTSVVLPILGLCELGNCPQTAACGVLVGSARPKVGACINFCSFYLVGLPVAALAAFKLEIGFLGLWYGLAAAQASCMCLMICTLVFTDWKHQAKRAKELTQATEDQKNDLEADLLS
ncbi:protein DETOXIFICATION 53-like isoform X1 [Herrania umbratica]|uniref:Protein DETOXIFICATION n=1 Tax=Herrania umbratica TaxID=108875 RepID=A0A6J1BDL4_9ROSI|nr:protein DETOXIFICATION 53-like isoform X1 [Herrania umbratica]XP_021297219.1 protein DETOXIFICATION 53-like isoform X1 [Herrania umbratica]XP_021297220.1 protein DETOXIFICATION 53-like isoform X1 [Herrania umbratica]